MSVPQKQRGPPPASRDPRANTKGNERHREGRPAQLHLALVAAKTQDARVMKARIEWADGLVETGVLLGRWKVRPLDFPGQARRLAEYQGIDEEGIAIYREEPLGSPR